MSNPSEEVLGLPGGGVGEILSPAIFVGGGWGGEGRGGVEVGKLPLSVLKCIFATVFISGGWGKGRGRRRLEEWRQEKYNHQLQNTLMQNFRFLG